MAVEEKWYQEGPPVIEELAERLWAYESIVGKLPWDQLGVQGRVGPRRKAYEMLEIVVSSGCVRPATASTRALLNR